MFEPVLTAKTDMNPVPRVEILFNDVHPDTETATVWRVAHGVSEEVRGAIRVFAGGGFATVDTEAPHGLVSYSAEQFDAAGLPLGFTGTSSVTLTLQRPVLHQPLDPQRAVEVTELSGTARELVRPFEGDLVNIPGRSMPVWVGSGRTGLRGVRLELLTETPEQEIRMRSVFGVDGVRPQLPVICYRSPSNLGLPRPFFAVVRDPKRVNVNTHLGGTAVRWSFDADQVVAPAKALTAGVLTYADMEFAFATYSEAEAAYLTYLDAESDFSKAGLA